MISANIVADSVNAQGNRLTTYKLRYPKFIHGEFMTHRVLSRNASSSRAVPVSKLIAEVRNPEQMVWPVKWPAEQRGMQGGVELEGNALGRVKQGWYDAAQAAARYAQSLIDNGLHKSLANRILEPFSHINVVASGTEWENFFGLRLDAQAQPEMRALAVAMWEARKASEPKLLTPGDWHLPFIDPETLTEVGHRHTNQNKATEEMIKISVARCARVSYESFETGKRSTVEEDLKLYDRLLSSQPLHASPAEHQGTPDSISTSHDFLEHPGVVWNNPKEHANFCGWRQYRKMLPGEALAPLPEEYR